MWKGALEIRLLLLLLLLLLLTSTKSLIDSLHCDCQYCHDL